MTISIGSANREALERLCRARPAWTGMTPPLDPFVDALVAFGETFGGKR